MPWSPQAREAIDAALAAAPEHDSPIAVFDFDNTCILNDVGELFGHYLVEQMLYRLDLDAFWELIDPRDGRDTIRELAQQALAIPEAERSEHEVYRQYVADLGAVYGRRLEREGKRDCYAWAVTLHVGISELDMTTLSQRAIRQELGLDPYTQSLTTTRGETLTVERGMRMSREIKGLFDELKAGGIEPWIVSASNRWTVAAFAPMFGIDPTHVVGNQVEVEAGILSENLIQPALFAEGKVGAIDRDIGRRPLLAFGDSETDWDMLESAVVSGVFVDTGKPITARAEAKGWAIQPQSDFTWYKGD